MVSDLVVTQRLCVQALSRKMASNRGDNGESRFDLVDRELEARGKAIQKLKDMLNALLERNFANNLDGALRAEEVPCDEGEGSSV